MVRRGQPEPIVSTKVSPKAVAKLSLRYDKLAGARYSLFILKVIGVWPWNSNGITKRHLLNCFLIQSPFLLLFNVLVWIEMFRSSALNQMAMALTFNGNIARLTNMLVLHNRMSALLDEFMHNSLYDLITDEEVKVWKKEQARFRWVQFIFLLCGHATLICAHLTVLFFDDYRLSIPYWLPFEWQTPDRYWYAYSYGTIALTVECYFGSSVDMLVFYMTFHIAILYKILGMRYANIRDMDEACAIKELRKLILVHASIKRTAEKCEALISNFVLILVVLNALIICFCGYQLQMTDIRDELDQFSYSLFFIFAMLLEIFMPCYFGSEVATNSEGLLFNIYDCNWMDFSITNRKFVRLYMEFFKEPHQFKAGKYFTISLPLFSKIVNYAYTLLAVLVKTERK